MLSIFPTPCDSYSASDEKAQGSLVIVVHTGISTKEPSYIFSYLNKLELFSTGIIRLFRTGLEWKKNNNEGGFGRLKLKKLQHNRSQLQL